MTNRTNHLLAGVALVGVVAAFWAPDHLMAQYEPPGACVLGELPDRSCTPGAIATTDRAEICGVVGGLTYTKRHRVWEHRDETMIRYGVPPSDRRQYEDDDLVPVDAGGNNADPKNHWAEVNNRNAPDGLGYEAKDWLDAYAKTAICRLNIPVATVQGWFLGDWRVAYRRLRGGQ